MTNYSRGADFERAVKADLERRGYFAMRSAGSHGPVDILALKTLEPWFIQVKINGRISPADRSDLRLTAGAYGAVPILASRPKPGRIRYQRLLPNDSWDDVKP